MKLVVCSLTTPVKLCVICQRTEETCQREGPHIFDSISYGWAVVDEEVGQPISFHVNMEEASRAMSRYQAWPN